MFTPFFRKIKIQIMKTESEKWLEERLYDFNQDKIEALLDMIESQSEVIQQYLNSPYKAQKGVLESCCEHNKLFIQKVRYENT